MELMDLLNVQSLARGNSGATGMEFNAQYIYNATPKQSLWLCVCVERERQSERERVVLPLECATECLFMSVLIQNDAEEHQSSVRLLNFAVSSAQLGSISEESLLRLPRRTD